MWMRDTWHNCASELEIISAQFREAHQQSDRAKMADASREGVALLRALALAVRSEQDFKLVPHTMATVGARKPKGASSSDASGFAGHKACLARSGFKELPLRGALNCIAHADPRRGAFYATASVHDLLLFGERDKNQWCAAISIPKLVEAIRSLPDHPMLAP